MLKEFEHLPHRPNIAVILRYNKKFLVVTKPDWKEDWWKFVQGGIHENETPEQTALRELKEEIGSDNVQILGVSKHDNTYDWPDELLIRAKYKLYRGQTQKFVVADFKGSIEEIHPDEEEISQIKWLSKEEILYLADNSIGTFNDYHGVIQKIFKEFDL
jgi:putative (di)nucleoside polyphosphate hydrolase